MNPFKSALGAMLPASLHPRTVLRQRLEAATRDGIVLEGPFAGMRYVSDAVGSMWWPKILGTYERELADVVHGLCLARPAWIIDIGAAEGYYAVGMAWRCPESRVIAFEGEMTGRKLQIELASLNGVSSRLQINGFCDHAALGAAVAEGRSGMIICDIEGGEYDLLDPKVIPELGSDRWTLLVELHDHVDPRITNTLIERFFGTHNIEEFVSRPRTARDLPPAVSGGVLARWVPAYLDERRPGEMRWLLLRPIV